MSRKATGIACLGSDVDRGAGIGAHLSAEEHTQFAAAGMQGRANEGLGEGAEARRRSGGDVFAVQRRPAFIPARTRASLMRAAVDIYPTELEGLSA